MIKYNVFEKNIYNCKGEESKISNKRIYKFGAIFLLSTMLFHANKMPIHAIDADEQVAYSQFIQNGNAITHYINEEDGKEKTIIWVKGITPPKMGGEQSDFKKEITKVPNSSIEYIEYHAPYVSGQGWYDVNKSNIRGSDANLCFAAAASNTLHWWLDQNTEYISKYLKENPDAPKAKEIEELRHSFKNQMESDIFQIFVRQFGNRIEGYWPDILIDQFINGYYPKANGGTNDPSFDGDHLTSKGPDPHGGFFYPVFGIQNLTERQYYSQGYEEISKNLKERILNGDMALMTISLGRSSHVVTLWGVEYDTNGKISAVYYSDSDDQRSIGMSRYRIINSNGAAIATTSNNGRGSVVESMNYISLGKEIWEEKLHITKKELNLVWENTNFTYTGELQGPTVKATNIDKGDDVILEVEGQQREAGNYTAIVLLKGASAQHYKLPENHTKEFKIQRAVPQVTLNAKIQESEDAILLEADVVGVNSDTVSGSVQFIDCTSGNIIAEETLTPSTEGKSIAIHSWTKMKKELYHLKAIYQGNNNYTEAISKEIELDLSKKPQVNFQIGQIEPKRYGDAPFLLSTVGGNGNGVVTYQSSDPSILSISGDKATIHKVGSVTITATKEEDNQYQSATATSNLNIQKGLAPELIYPTASDLTYGESLANANLIGGSTKYGTFKWEDENIVPPVNNNGYRVLFIPNEHTVENYETITSTVQSINVSVQKASPKLAFRSKVDPDSSSVILSASIEASGNGELATGYVHFVDCISGKVLTSEGIPLVNGEASYTWNNVPAGVHEVKVVYDGDSNYSNTESAPVMIDIHKQTQEALEFMPIESKTYGDAPFLLYTHGGSGNGELTFTSSNSDIISISNNVATIHKAGIATIIATKAEDEDYNETQASVVVKIQKKTLTITAEDQFNILQGSPLPNLTFKIDGLINGDTVITNPVLNADVNSTNEIGEYDIFINGGEFTNQESYQITYVNGKLTIKKEEVDEINPEPPVINPDPPVVEPETPALKPESSIEKPSNIEISMLNKNTYGNNSYNEQTKETSKEESNMIDKDSITKKDLKKKYTKKTNTSSKSKDSVINPKQDKAKKNESDSNYIVVSIIGVASIVLIGSIITKYVLVKKRKRKFKR